MLKEETHKPFSFITSYMPHKIRWKFLILFIFSYSIKATAQKNLIDVPTSEIVEYKKTFLQTQSSITNRNISTSIIATLGLKNNWETGLMFNQLTVHTRSNSRKLNIDKEEPSQNPDVFLHIQKIFRINDWYKVVLEVDQE